MPTYKINARNSFQVNGVTYFVARTRYMDDGMTVFRVSGGQAHEEWAFWQCLLTPERTPYYPRNRTCREQARLGIELWEKYHHWLPTPEQLKIIAEPQKHGITTPSTCYHNFIHSPESYAFWYRHFHAPPEPIRPAEAPKEISQRQENPELL